MKRAMRTEYSVVTEGNTCVRMGYAKRKLSMETAHITGLLYPAILKPCCTSLLPTHYGSISDTGPFQSLGGICLQSSTALSYPPGGSCGSHILSLPRRSSSHPRLPGEFSSIFGRLVNPDECPVQS